MKRFLSVLLMICLVMSMLTGCSLLSRDPYVVQFITDGGKRVGGGPLLQEVYEGEAAQLPEVERDGYDFDGWDASADQVSSNMVIHALWTKKVTATFEMAGGELVTGELEQVISEGETPEEPTVKRDKYVFNGWDKKIDAISEDTVYTALWTEKTYSSEEIYDMLSKSVGEITIYDMNGQALALGSGFFIDEEGTMATNYHVIEGGYSADVLFNDGTVADIDQVIAYNVELDLAIVHVALDHASIPVSICERDIKTGESVYALGSSEGLTNTFSEGIVSNVSRILDGKECIQITAPISHGNSGGPCVNAYCEVIGINSMVYNQGQNLNFAINIHELDKLEPYPMTMDALFSLMGYDQQAYTGTYCSVYGGEGNYTIVDTGDEAMYVYDDADFVEWEDNGSTEFADILLNGYWTGAYSDISMEDIDCFTFSLEKDSDIDIFVLPFYMEDADELVCILFDDHSEDLLATLTKEEQDGVIYLGLSADDLPAGTYYVAVAVEDPDNYQYETGPYYEICAQWGDF